MNIKKFLENLDSMPRNAKKQRLLYANLILNKDQEEKKLIKEIECNPKGFEQIKKGLKERNLEIETLDEIEEQNKKLIQKSKEKQNEEKEKSYILDSDNPNFYYKRRNGLGAHYLFWSANTPRFDLSSKNPIGTFEINGKILYLWFENGICFSRLMYGQEDINEKDYEILKHNNFIGRVKREDGSYYNVDKKTYGINDQE